jgi:hyperosmotically inducible periplasmic protein
MSPKWIGSTQPELKTRQMNMTNEFIEKAMKSATIKPVLGAIAMALLLSTTGCTAMTGETAGQYVDDSTITAAVKAKLVADKAANLTRVDVDTTKQVVSLNGIVESADQKARAEQLAKQVDGVRKVDNNLQIQKKN